MRTCIKWVINLLILFFFAMIALDKTLVLSRPVYLLMLILSIVLFRPFSFLLEHAIGADQFFSKLLRPIDELTDRVLTRESPLPNAKYLRFMILGIVSSASVIFIFFAWMSGLRFQDFGQIILDSTLYAQFIDFTMTSEHFFSAIKSNFTLTAVISLGISSFLSFLYMRCTLETVRGFNKNRMINFLLVLVFSLAFIIISGILTEQIQAFCLAVADAVERMILFLEKLYYADTKSLPDVLNAVFCVVLFLILCPLTLYLLILTTREVIATLLYGSLAIFFLLAFCTLCLCIISCFPNAPEWFHSVCYFLIKISFPIVALVPDYIRSTDTLKERLFEIIRKE